MHMSEIKKYTIEFIKVLSDQTRLDILDLLNQGNKTSAEIQKELKKSQSTISQHLKLLINANLVDSESNKVGRKLINYYKLKHLEIFRLLSEINSFVIKINKEKFVDLRDLDVIDTLF